MHLRYQLMRTLQDERLRTAARDHLAAEARRARTAGRDHAAAARAGATASGAATMPGKQDAITGLGIPLGAISLFPQGIIAAVRKLARARGLPWALKVLRQPRDDAAADAPGPGPRADLVVTCQCGPQVRPDSVALEPVTTTPNVADPPAATEPL
jgi:hypothetical protein